MTTRRDVLLTATLLIAASILGACNKPRQVQPAAVTTNEKSNSCNATLADKSKTCSVSCAAAESPTCAATKTDVSCKCFPRTAVGTSGQAEKSAFKGMELYSWKTPGEDWRFSLLAGTNRLKTDQEIKDPEQTIVGMKELKKRLAKLAKGENVFWKNLATEPVPEAMAKALKTSCDNIKIELEGTTNASAE